VNERIAVDSQILALTQSLGICEKLLRTPIPLGYTRYSVRFLWVWLSLLPFALTNTFSQFGVGTWWENKPQPVVVLAMLFIGFIFLSMEGARRPTIPGLRFKYSAAAGGRARDAIRRLHLPLD
jgi:predicted membrane chloride channel (bestrophin family)